MVTLKKHVQMPEGAHTCERCLERDKRHPHHPALLPAGLCSWATPSLLLHQHLLAPLNTPFKPIIQTHQESRSQQRWQELCLKQPWSADLERGVALGARREVSVWGGRETFPTEGDTARHATPRLPALLTP